MREADQARVRAYVDRLDAARATRAQEIADDVDPVRSLTLAERGAWIASVCRSAWAILAARPDAGVVISTQDRPAADFAAKWAVLVARRRATSAGPRS